MTDGNAEHPAAYLDPMVAELRRRATLVLIAFGAVIVARGAEIAIRAWSVHLLRTVPESAEEAVANLDAVHGAMAGLATADSLIRAISIALVIAFLVSAVAFLRWVHRLVDLARVLTEDLRWEPGQAVIAFFIPFVSLIRPYQVLFATYGALAPNKVPRPPPRVDPATVSDYRSVEFVEASPPRRLPRAWLGPWWAAFLLMSIGAWAARRLETPTTPDDLVTAHQAEIFVSAAAILAAALGVTVVRGLTARLEERFRRVCESTPEALSERGIRIR